MQRLSGLDASFLYLETAKQPLHVCSVLELDTSTMPGGYTFDRLRDALALRIKAMPQFREKLADSRFNPDHPVWVDDKDFDVDRHLHRIGLPSPGGRRELAEICGHIASLSLDRSRPLWETWVIENIAGTDAHEGGRLAVMTKVHHAGVDGVTGANLMSQLCSTEPDAPAPDPVDGVGDASEPGNRVERRGQVRHQAVEAGQRNSDHAVVGGGHRQARPQRPGHGRAVRSAEDRVQCQRHRSPQHRVRPARPRGHQDGEEPLRCQGERRRDGLVSGVLRKFLADRGELPDNSLVAMVPVSVHEKSDRPVAIKCRVCSPSWRPTSRTRPND